MTVLLDDKQKGRRAVRALLYDDAAELTGDIVETSNAGKIECEAGSIAFKAGFEDMKQLNSAGSWIDC